MADVVRLSRVEAEQRLIVSLTIPRSGVPPGRFSADLEVSGPGIAAVATTRITLRHQEPITRGDMSGWGQAAWLGVSIVVCALLVLAMRRWPNLHGLLVPPLVVASMVLLYPAVAWLLGTRPPALRWPIWLGAAGLIGGFLIAVLKYTSNGARVEGGVRLGAAVAISFGAGLAVWRSEYLNTPDWALQFDSAFSLIGVVGAATTTSALLLLQPVERPRTE